VRVLLLIALPAAAAAAASFARADARAAGVAFRFALAFAPLVVLGRGLRLGWERRAGASRYRPFRDPVFEGMVGLWASASAVLVLSFFVKRVLSLHEPLGVVVPLATTAAAALLVLREALRGPAASEAQHPSVLPGVAGLGRLALFFAGFAWLAGDHLGALRGYSSDPNQHIAWLSQLRHFGFAPDLYLGTSAPVTYPQGFHALLHALGGGLVVPASALVAGAPAFASAVFVYLLVAAGRDLAPGSGGTRGALAVGLELLAFLAFGSAFHSSQFSIWNVHEGTARLAAGLLHVPLVLAGLALSRERPASGATPAGSDHPAWLRHALPPFAVIALGALVTLLNPMHLPLHGVLSAGVLGAYVWRVRGEAGRALGAALGAAAGVGLAIVLVAGDPVGRDRILGVASRADAELSAVEAEFDRDFAVRTCREPGCVVSALFSLRTLEGAVLPLRSAIEGPVRVLFGQSGRRNAAPLFRGPHHFPDLTGGGMAPEHGAALRYVLIALIGLGLMFPTLRRGRALRWGLAWIFLACVVDGGLRGALSVWVHPDDATLHLLPSYANRASAVLFAQSFWPVLGAAVLFGLNAARVARTDRSARVAQIALAGIAAGLAAVWFSAEGELRARQEGFANKRSGPTAADLRDLWALEDAHIPAREHYLVSSQTAVSNRERWLVPIDPDQPLYLQARRPALFLYHLSSGARIAARDFEATCAALSARPGPTPLLERYGARWVAMLAANSGLAEQRFARRHFCARRLPEVFPAAELAGYRGRVALFRLW
jgi:hypothetical protein